MSCSGLAKFTDAELERAIRSEALFTGRPPPPKKALGALAVALFEHEINSILHMPDEDAAFQQLQQPDRDRLLRDAAWLLGRLAIAGYRTFHDPIGARS